MTEIHPQGWAYVESAREVRQRAIDAARQFEGLVEQADPGMLAAWQSNAGALARDRVAEMRSRLAVCRSQLHEVVVRAWSHEMAVQDRVLSYGEAS